MASVAQPGDTARITDNTVRLLDYEITGQVDGEFGSSTARGEFVIVRVAITNLTNGPQDIGINTELTSLQVADNMYSEDFESSTLIPGAFASRAPLQIQPEETLEGSFVFDVPDQAAERIEQGRGGLFVGNLSAFSLDDSREAAVLALNKTEREAGG